MEFEQVMIILISGLYGAVIILILMWMKMIRMEQNRTAAVDSGLATSPSPKFDTPPKDSICEQSDVAKLEATTLSFAEIAKSNGGFHFKISSKELGSEAFKLDTNSGDGSLLNTNQNEGVLKTTSVDSVNSERSGICAFCQYEKNETIGQSKKIFKSATQNRNFNSKISNTGRSQERKKLAVQYTGIHRQNPRKINSFNTNDGILQTTPPHNKFASLIKTLSLVNKTTSEFTFSKPYFVSDLKPKKIEDTIHEINDLEELLVPETRFHRDLPTEEFKKWCSDDKFLIMGPDQEILRHEKILYVIVHDLMPNIEFLKKYGTQIEHLRIYCKSVNKVQPSIYTVISENCSQNLKEIEFYDLEGDEINLFTKEFPVIERIQFKSGKIGQNVVDAFKRNFSNVQKLEFSHTLTTINDRRIINGYYNNLKSFEAPYDESGTIFDESDIESGLNMNKDHLQKIILWGVLSPTFLSFISDKFPQLKKMSIKKVPERVIAHPPNGRLYAFKQLHQFEMSSVFTARRLSCPFDFGHLQKVILDLRFLPDSWIDDFLVKNPQINHLSLSITPIGINDSMISKITKALPNLRYLEIDNASNVCSTTIMKLLEDKNLNDLLFSHFNSFAYSLLRSESEKIKALGWSVKLFSKFYGAKFERNKEKETNTNSDVFDSVKRKTEKIKAAQLYEWYETQVKNKQDATKDLKEKGINPFIKTADKISNSCTSKAPQYGFKHTEKPDFRPLKFSIPCEATVSSSTSTVTSTATVTTKPSFIGFGSSFSYGTSTNATMSTTPSFGTPAFGSFNFGTKTLHSKETSHRNEAPSFGTHVNFPPVTFGTAQPSPIFGENSLVFRTVLPAFKATESTKTTSIFGSSNTTVWEKSFTGFGTSAVKYQPTIGTDAIDSKIITTRFNNITAMVEYKEKSVDELRLEHYKNKLL